MDINVYMYDNTLKIFRKTLCRRNHVNYTNEGVVKPEELCHIYEGVMLHIRKMMKE